MTISLRVKPGRSVDLLAVDAAGLLTVKIKAPAQDGRANAYLLALLAREPGIPKSTVTITAGFTSPHKRLTIDVSVGEYERFLARIRGA